MVVQSAWKIAFGPDVFANGDADSPTGDGENFPAAARLEVAVFIEDIVSRQKRLEAFADRLAALEQGSGVEERLAAIFVAISAGWPSRRSALAA